MKISFNTDDALGQLAAASKVVNQKNQLPILGDFVIRTFGNRKTAIVTASDSEVWVETKIPLTDDGGEDFSFAVSVKDFMSALGRLGGHVVTLELNGEKNVVNGSYMNGKFSIPYDNPDDFPQPFFDKEGSTEVIMDAQKLVDSINTAKFAVGNSNIRPVLNGIYIVFKENGIEVAATNSNKMVRLRDTTFGTNVGEPQGITIPAKPCIIITQMVSRYEGEVKIAFNQNKLIVSRSEFRIVANLYEGNYPDYNRFVRSESALHATVCREDLLSALKRVMPLGNMLSELVCLEFADNEITVSVESIDFSKSASERVKCDFQGETITIGMNGTYLCEMLSNIQTDNVVFGMDTPTKPVIITPETQDDGMDYLSQVMPMLLSI